MAGRLPVARRQELAASAYELSLQGHSFREIARLLDISHPTAASLVHEEAKLRRDEREDPGQRLRDSIKLALRRAWKELENPEASSHATSQNLFALNNLLVTYGKLTGAFSPERLQVATDRGHYFPNEGFALLTNQELELVKLLADKATGHLPPDFDILANLPVEAEPLQELEGETEPW